MRDPARIDRILSKLRALWVRYPDLRLAQMVVNFSDKYAPEVFVTEDDIIERALDSALQYSPTDEQGPQEVQP